MALDLSDLIQQITTLDFESEAIGPRPNEYPPKPVGLSVRWPNGKTEYIAWAHPAGDNTHTFEEARNALLLAYSGPVLFHNAAFDMEVAYQHMGMPFPRDWHDTLFLLFLFNPHARTYALKESAEEILKVAPDERDAVRDWVLANVAGSNKKTFGAHISKAPVALVGPYAIGDVDRTFALFKRLAPPVLEAQGAAYTREKRLLPHLLAAERRGIRVDRPLLEQWRVRLDSVVEAADKVIRAGLNAPTLNVDSNDELAAALQAAGQVTHWETTDGMVLELDGTPRTPTAALLRPPISFATASPEPTAAPGKRSMAKDVLVRIIKDRHLSRLLVYRNSAATMLRTFVDAWLALSAADGRLHTKWHQVRGVSANGTKTGRIASSNPNLANVPNPANIEIPTGWPALPSLREALLPEEGEVWVSADYSQQELRIAAHFEDGEIQAAYRRNPKLDLHTFAQELIEVRTGLKVERKKTKTVAFASIYGAGIGQLAAQMGVPLFEANEVRNAYFKALPGLGDLIRNVEEEGLRNGKVRTIGGRVIPVEKAKLQDGRWRSFVYKLLNHLVQGSAADQTKQAIVDFCERGGSGMFLTTVYDEINLSVRPEQVADVNAALVAAMKAAIPLDVPIEVDVESGPNWGELK